jgi:hypothetical protein
MKISIARKMVSARKPKKTRKRRAVRSMSFYVQLPTVDSPFAVSERTFHHIEQVTGLRGSDLIQYCLARLRDRIVVTMDGARRAILFPDRESERMDFIAPFPAGGAGVLGQVGPVQPETFETARFRGVKVMRAARRVLARLAAETAFNNAISPKTATGTMALSTIVGQFEARIVLAEREADARVEVLSSAHWLRISALPLPAVRRETDLARQLRQWEAEGRIFGFSNDGVKYFPGYGMRVRSRNGKRRVAPVAALKKVIRIFKNKREGLDLAIWFANVNPHLGDRSPRQLLCSKSEEVVAAALHDARRIRAVRS